MVSSSLVGLRLDLVLPGLLSRLCMSAISIPGTREGRALRPVRLSTESSFADPLSSGSPNLEVGVSSLSLISSLALKNRARLNPLRQHY